MEIFDNGYLDIYKKSNNIYIDDLIYHNRGTLPYDEEYDSNYYSNVFAHAFSKYAYLLDCDVVDSPVQSNGIVCLTTKNETVVDLLFEERNYKNSFNLKRFDVLLFPDFINANYNKNIVNTTIYPIKNKTIDGVGDKLYEVSLTLSDTYVLKLYANSKKDAIDQSYKIGLTKFNHIFKRDALPEDGEYITQITRGSIWHKGMLKAKEL